ncbi:MAG: DUF1189 family protein [Candidatus Moranbacteria bacterium]|nr:DUF1189 family protein [Candidatus Moranbacteria bacterium]
MKFLQTVRDSVYNPAFYRLVLSGAGPSAMRYFSSVVAIVAIVVTIMSAVSFFPWLSSTGGIEKLRTTMLSAYPDELALQYRDGHVTSNVEEPYVISMPAESGAREGSTSTDQAPQNLLVIDTTHAVVPQDLDRYRTAAILAGDAIWTKDSKGIQVHTFEDWKRDPFTLDKTVVTGFVDKIAEVMMPMIIIGFALLPLVLFVAFSIGYLAYLLFGALIIMIVGKVRKIDISYSVSYRLGLFLITLPVAYGLLRSAFPILNVPFLFTIILAIAAYVNLEPAKSETVTAEKTDLWGGKESEKTLTV